MKTAMQELRDSINMSYVHMTMAPETKDIYIYKIALKETLDKIDALLEKEKQQIVEAHGIKGWYKVDDKTSGVTTGEDYYNQKYKNE